MPLYESSPVVAAHPRDQRLAKVALFSFSTSMMVSEVRSISVQKPVKFFLCFGYCFPVLYQSHILLKVFRFLCFTSLVSFIGFCSEDESPRSLSKTSINFPLHL